MELEDKDTWLGLRHNDLNDWFTFFLKIFLCLPGNISLFKSRGERIFFMTEEIKI